MTWYHRLKRPLRPSLNDNGVNVFRFQFDLQFSYQRLKVLSHFHSQGIEGFRERLKCNMVPTLDVSSTSKTRMKYFSTAATGKLL
jgi:hypothetical protein